MLVRYFRPVMLGCRPFQTGTGGQEIAAINGRNEKNDVKKLSERQGDICLISNLRI